MAIGNAILKGLESVPELNDSNWFTWSKPMIKFLNACGAQYVHDPLTAAVPKDKEVLDGEINWLIYGKVSEDWQYLVADVEHAWESWKALKGQFEKSTMGSRLKARSEFHNVVHDPSKPISHYVQSVMAARAVLKSLGHEPDDVETGDVLLMNLHSSFDTIRTTILTSKDEPSLSTIKSTLLGSTASADVFIKSEPSPIALAARAGGRRGFGTGGSGYGAGGSGYGSREDEKGFRWCDPTQESACHRCGRPGHIAARCIHDMPQHVKDWVMSPPGRSASAQTASVLQDEQSARLAAATAYGKHLRQTLFTREAGFAGSDEEDEGGEVVPDGGYIEESSQVFIHS